MILSPYATEPICETDERQLQNSFSLKERAEKIKQCVEQVMTRGQHHEHLRPRSGTCQFGLNCGKSGMRSLISFLTESAAVPVVMTSSLPLLIPQCASLHPQSAMLAWGSFASTSSIKVCGMGKCSFSLIASFHRVRPVIAVDGSGKR